jgi:hypothetical protein
MGGKTESGSIYPAGKAFSENRVRREGEKRKISPVSVSPCFPSLSVMCSDNTPAAF